MRLFSLIYILWFIYDEFRNEPVISPLNLVFVVQDEDIMEDNATGHNSFGEGTGDVVDSNNFPNTMP